MSRRIIIFDLDGTLVDSRRDLTTAVNLMRADFGLGPLSLEDVSGLIGDGIGKLTARAVSEADGVDLDAAAARMGHYYRQHLVDETVVYPGVMETLEACRARGYLLGLATNKTLEATHGVLAGLELAHCFDAVAGDGSVANLKPAPDLIDKVVELTGAVKSGSWVVGDNHTDLGAGRRAGLLRCFCRYGFGSAGDEAWDLAIDCIADLLKTHI